MIFGKFGLATGSILAATVIFGASAEATSRHRHHHHKAKPANHHYHHDTKPKAKAAPAKKAAPGNCGTFKYYSRKTRSCMDARLKK